MYNVHEDESQLIESVEDERPCQLEIAENADKGMYCHMGMWKSKN
jgi:hypothetical protein